MSHVIVTSDGLTTCARKLHTSSTYDVVHDGAMACPLHSTLMSENVTFWVKYSPGENGFTVHNAYCHRMKIVGISQ